RGVRLALPRIRQGEIAPVAYRPGDPVDRAAFGALEPSAGEELDPPEVDVVVTPGVAFDRQGFRVGYGGGFYDRFFRRTRGDAFRVAIGFALEVVALVPRGPADEPVDAVVTEDEVIHCPRR
ncbi:MAG TPA: 5-formyltetrahydrofolate cyclo-ligase, partial [Actinomycetota bacterium]|nr:5-formyltetrahydrofolate cyclo-ligase [Actinomycetota bacterium]